MRIRGLADEGSKRAKTVMRITDDTSKMLSAILIGNNVVNLSAASLTTTLAYNLGGSMVAVASAVLSVLIILFGEITPKTMATLHAEKMSLRYAPAINLYIKVMTPFVFIINTLSDIILRILHIDPNAGNKQMTESELRTIVDVSHESGVIESDEKEMIYNVFDLGDAKAKDVMVPRVHVTFADVNATYEELIDIFREDKFTRLPIFEDTTDNVVGILNIKDLLLLTDTSQFSIRALMREPFFTYEHKNTAELFHEMKKNSINIAIVLDEYGTTVGLITLEDLIEEIVGDIRDEYDANEEADLTKISKQEYLVSGSMNLDDLCETLDLPFSSEDYDTVGGYVIGLLDHFPKEGEVITTKDGFTFFVKKMDKNRVEKILLTMPEKDWNWCVSHNTEGAELENASDHMAQLAVQGPKAILALQKLTSINLSELPYYTFTHGEFAGEKDVIISNTGYTGAGGFELYFYPEAAMKIWNAVFEAGEEFGIKPIGLGARDTLRLEMGFCLYGNDLDDTTSPIEAGLGWITKFAEGKNFINRPMLEKQKTEGTVRKLVGFEMVDRGIPRHGYELFNTEGEAIGVVTSGTMSPTRKIGIGMGYVKPEYSKIGTEICIDMRGRKLKAVVVRPPFRK